MRSATVLQLGVFAFAVWAAPAHADTVTIEYVITGGTVTAADPSITITGGTYRVTYQAVGTTVNHTVIAGPAILNSFSIQLTAAYQYSGLFASSSLLPLETGSFAGNGLGASVFQNVAQGRLVGTHSVHCISPATYCTYLGYAPSVPVPSLALSASLDAAGGLGLGPAGGTLMGTFFSSTISAAIYYGRATVNFTGQEINRTFVPEPSVAAQSVAALLSILGLSRRSARRRNPARGIPEGFDTPATGSP